MSTRAFLTPTIALSLAVGSLVRAIGDDLPSKDNPSPEPFSNIQPFDLSGQRKTNVKEAPQADINKALQRNPKVADEILKVNGVGDPEKIIFDGVKLFSEKQLRFALACDIKYQAAARPSNETGDFLGVLEKRLLEGYLNSGCPDATVRAWRDGQRKAVVVEIDEGPQYRKGQITITGTKAIDEQAIREFLTKPQHKRRWTYALGGKRLDIFAKEDESGKVSDGEPDAVTFWKSGEAVDFRRIDNSQLERGVRFALAELGFVTTPFRVELKRDAKQGVANLDISILQEAPPTVVADIEITGLKRDSREALLDYLKISPGDRLTSDTLMQLDERLTNSCRYWIHNIQVVAPFAPGRYSPQPEASKLNLVLTLEEYEPTPPLGQPLSPTDETIRKCADWVNSLTKGFGRRDLVVTTAAADLGGLLQHAQFILAPDGTCALDLQMAADDWRVDHSAIIGPHGIEIYDWQNARKFCFSRESLPILEVRTNKGHASDGKQDANLAIGYAFGKVDEVHDSNSMRCDIRVDPVVLLDISRRRLTNAVLKDNVLTLSDDTLELQIDQETGQIRSVKCASFLSAGVSAIDFRSKTRSAARAVEKIRRRGNDCQNLFDENSPLGSAITCVIQQIERQPSIQREPHNRAFWRMMDKVSTVDAFRRLTNAETYSALGGAIETNAFEIPGQPEFSFENWAECLSYYIPFLADKAFPRGSWPWTVLRELSFEHEDVGLSLNSNYVQCRREYDRMNGTREFGPLSGLAAAELFPIIYPNSPEAIAECAAVGLRDLSDEAFLRDVRLLTDGDHGLAVLSRSIAESCRNLSSEDKDDILKVLPPTLHGVFDGLAARRRAKPDEPPGDAIRAVMLEEWHSQWKADVETKLQAIAETARKSQPTHAAPK